MDADAGEEISALIGDLVQAARVPAKRRPFPVQPTVARLAELAYEHGLRPLALQTLVADVLTAPGASLDQASSGRLVRSLYPVGGAVTADTVVAVVGALGHGTLRPALAVQALLLRWLVLAYAAMATTARAVLGRAYGVLFNLLDTAALRPALCHVLALVTRRQHVRPFRIQATLALARQIGHDPALLGLLRVFKNYYPEVIVGDATRGRASPFKHPDPSWRAHLDELRLAHATGGGGTGGTGGTGGIGNVHGANDASDGHSFQVRRPDGRARRRGIASAVPPVRTLHAQESSVTLEEIDSADALVQHLEHVELPSHLVAVLADPLLQTLLQLRPADEAFARVDHWLASVVSSAVHGDGTADGHAELMDLLDVVHEYITSTRSFPPIFHRFFAAVLARWDGKDKKAQILESLAHVPVTQFEDTYASVYQPLEARLLDNDVQSQIDLLAFHTRVLQQWAVAMTEGDAGETEGPAGETETDAAADAVADTVADTVADAVTDAKTDTGRAEARSTQALVAHANRLVLAAVQNAAGPGGVSTRAALAAVDFYEAVTAVLRRRRDEVLAGVQDLIPPPAVVFALHFSHSAAVASRLYGVLADYKRAMEAAMARRPSRSSAVGGTAGAGGVGGAGKAGADSPLGHPLTDDERARINLFNGYLMDVCNCLWRSRAFSSKDTNALGCRVDAAVVARLAAYVQGLLDRELPLTAAFNISHAPTLCLQAVSYLRQLEEEALAAAAAAAAAATEVTPITRRHAGPVSQAALVQLANAGGIKVTWQAYRSGLLVFLEKQGLDGIAALMYNTMKNLMNARASA